MPLDDYSKQQALFYGCSARQNQDCQHTMLISTSLQGQDRACQDMLALQSKHPATRSDCVDVTSFDAECCSMHAHAMQVPYGF